MVTLGQFAAGWTPVGALQTGDGYEVAFGNGSGEYVVWNTDANGNFTSAATGILSSTTQAQELGGVEANFGENFAGVPAATSTTIGTNGQLAELGIPGVNGNLFELNPAGGGPLLELNGSVVTDGQFSAGWTPVGAEQTATGYEVAFKNAANQFVVWNVGANGDYTSAATGFLSGTSYALEQLELTFGEDLNGDTHVGPATTPIGTNGALTQVANQFQLTPLGGGTGPLLALNGSPVTVGEFPAGWTPVGAVQTPTGYEVAFSVPGQNAYTVWNTDSNGNFTSAATGVLSGTSVTLEGVEANFGDGTFAGAGSPATPTTIATNGTTTLAQLEVGGISQIGDLYELNPAAGGTGPLLEYQGAAATAGEFGPGLGTEQTATGYEVAWSLVGSDMYVVWNTDSGGEYTSPATGQVTGPNFTLEDLNPIFHENLNGAPSLSAFLQTTTTGSKGAVDLSAQTQNATIDMGNNSARSGNGLNGSHPNFSGTPFAITLGSNADIVEYALSPTSGIETVAGFNSSIDELNIALRGAPNGALQFHNITVNSAPAVSIYSSADPSHGLVLLNTRVELRGHPAGSHDVRRGIGRAGTCADRPPSPMFPGDAEAR